MGGALMGGALTCGALTGAAPARVVRTPRHPGRVPQAVIDITGDKGHSRIPPAPGVLVLVRGCARTLSPGSPGLAAEVRSI